MKKIFLIIIILLTTSCYDYKQPNEISIVNGIAIDYNDKYEITYEIIDTNKKDETYTIDGSALTLKSALFESEFKSLKDVSLSHLDVVIISPKVNLKDIIDVFLNSNKVNLNFYLVISNNPKEILENKSNIFKNNSKTIKNLLEENNYDNKNQFDYLSSYLINNLKDISLYNIILDKEIKLNNLVLIKDNKIISYLNNKDTKLYYLLDTHFNEVLYDDIKIKKSKLKIKYKNNKYYLDLKINSKEKINLEKLKKDLLDFIDNQRNNNIDILGLKEINYINNIKDYQNINKEIILNIEGETYE